MFLRDVGGVTGVMFCLSNMPSCFSLRVFNVPAWKFHLHWFAQVPTPPHLAANARRTSTTEPPRSCLPLEAVFSISKQFPQTQVSMVLQPKLPIKYTTSRRVLATTRSVLCPLVDDLVSYETNELSRSISARDFSDDFFVVCLRGRKLPLQEAAPRLLHLLRLSWLLAVANLALGRAAAAARLVITGVCSPVTVPWL